MYARVLSSGAGLMVLAYPSRGLDIATVQTGLEMVRDRCREGAGVLMISEDLDELLSVCDRIVVLHDGHIVASLKPDQTDRHADRPPDAGCRMITMPDLGSDRWRSGTRLVVVFVSSLIVFALLLVANGADPIAGYRAMWSSITRDSGAIGDVLVRMVPYLLGSLAVIVPARAGLFNIGGEGQLVLGSVGAFWAANALDQSAPRAVTLILMAVAGMAFAGGWALLAAGLRVFAATNEAISTLLLNYLATLVLGWLVFGRWKDPGSTGFPRTRALEPVESLPVMWGRVHIGHRRSRSPSACSCGRRSSTRRGASS